MDLIDREQAISYLEKHKDWCKENMCLLAADEDAIIKFLETKCKAVDAVPVVRCKDCKYLSNKDSDYCCYWESTVEADDFCSWGERREG